MFKPHFKIYILAALTMMAVGGQKVSAQTVYNLRINEIMSANIDQVLDPTWNYGSWVEIYNPSGTTLSLKGLWLSDDPNKLRKWPINHDLRVNPRSCVCLWFGHHSPYYWPNQIDGTLDADGGTLCLSTTAGRLIQSVDFPPAIPRASYARLADGTGEWGYTSTPTPSTTNAGIQHTWERLPAPQVEPQSQVFTSSVRIHVEIPQGATLRYTMDGSTPSPTHGITNATGTLSTAGTRIFRFALFQEGKLMSPVVTRSFIKRDKNFNIPVVSVVSDERHFYDPQIGFLTQGSNGRRGKGTDLYCNWNQDWDRPVNIEVFHPKTGQQLLNMEAEMSRAGGHSKGFTPYSFKITAKKKYEGQNFMPYAFFPDQPYHKHKGLQFRCGGNDYMYRLKDAALQSIVHESGIDVDHQNYLPVAHYINGKYMGTINMRETHNKNHTYANFGLDEEEIDMYEIDCDSGYVQKCGTREAWLQLKSLAAKAADPVVYSQVKNLLDIDEFCNYMAIQTYMGNQDWPQNNLQCWRPRIEGGKFRFILFDLDFGFYQSDPFPNFAGRQWHSFCQLFDVPNKSQITGEVEVVPIFMGLIRNDEFRRHFVNAFCLVAGSVFQEERSEQLVNRLANTVEYLQTRESGYPGRNNSPRPSAQEVINGLRGRAELIHGSLQRFSQFGISGSGLHLHLTTATPGAQLSLGGQTIPHAHFHGRVYPPFSLTAQAPQNCRFVGWRTAAAVSLATGHTLFPMGSEWKYSCQGPVPANWRHRIYQDKDWPMGHAPLGYGAHYAVGTQLSYGPDGNNKYPTYYFRRTFQIDEMPAQGNNLVLEYRMDDGFVVYINGKEAARVNMASGAVGYNTYSSASVATQAQGGTVMIDPSLLRQGENLIAIEVHNTSATSSDILWDASLAILNQTSVEAGQILSTSPQLDVPQYTGDLQLEAVFESHTSHCPVVINEVSASNSIYVNEYFKKNDWIELYNLSPEPLDLEGFYLSDNAADPLKHRISAQGTQASTIIPAHGHAVVWCDKLPTQSQLHVDFKLANADSSAVILTAADQSWADTLIYCAHDGMHTVGRFPDGGAQLYTMYRPTIGTPNRMNLYTLPYHAPAMPAPSGPADGIDQLMAQHSGALSITTGPGHLTVKSEDGLPLVLTLHTTDGTLAMRQELQMNAPTQRITLPPLAHGIYIARATDAQGNHCQVKFTR